MAVHALRISILRNIFLCKQKARLLHRAFKLDCYAITVILYKREFRWFFSRPLILWFWNQLCWLFLQRCDQLLFIWTFDIVDAFIIHAVTPLTVTALSLTALMACINTVSCFHA